MKGRATIPRARGSPGRVVRHPHPDFVGHARPRRAPPVLPHAGRLRLRSSSAGLAVERRAPRRLAEVLPRPSPPPGGAARRQRSLAGPRTRAGRSPSNNAVAPRGGGTWPSASPRRRGLPRLVRDDRRPVPRTSTSAPDGDGEPRRSPLSRALCRALPGPPPPVSLHRLPAERPAVAAGGTGADVRGDRPSRSPRSPSSSAGSAPSAPAALKQGDPERRFQVQQFVNPRHVVDGRPLLWHFARLPVQNNPSHLLRSLRPVTPSPAP